MIDTEIQCQTRYKEKLNEDHSSFSESHSSMSQEAWYLSCSI